MLPWPGRFHSKYNCRSRHECEDNLEAILIGVLVCVCVLILICMLATAYYHRRRRMTPPAPLQRIARVRSKVYTRLYPKEKYERPLAKREFVVRAEDLLRLPEDEVPEKKIEDGASFYSGVEPWERRVSAKVAAEFAELEQICFHTIQGCQRNQLSPFISGI